MSFAEKLAAQPVARGGPKCKTCVAIEALTKDDRDAYEAALEDIKAQRIPASTVARALGIVPNSYLLHYNNSHDAR